MMKIILSDPTSADDETKQLHRPLRGGRGEKIRIRNSNHSGINRSIAISD